MGNDAAAFDFIAPLSFVIELKNFSVRGPHRTLFAPRSFVFEQGKVYGITGEGACGKTTLTLAIGGLLAFHVSDAIIEGTLSNAGLVYQQGTKLDGYVYVGDNPYAQLSGIKETVFEEVILPLEARGVVRGTIETSANVLINLFGLTRVRASRLRWLSGGECQRLNIASALGLRPRILVLDGTIAELDSDQRHDLLAFLNLYADLEGAICLVTYRKGEVESDFFHSELDLAPLEPFPVDTQHDFLVNAPISERVDLKVEGLTYEFPDTDRVLFRDFSLRIPSGKLVLLLGGNGSGKSTLFRLLTRDIKPPGGTIFLNGTDIDLLKDDTLYRIIRCAFQNPDLSFSRPTIEDELNAIPSENGWPSDLAHFFHVSKDFSESPFDLPRGKRKLLSLVVLFTAIPNILLLDEPTEYSGGADVQKVGVLVEHLRNRRVTVICASHDPRLISLFRQLGADEIALPYSVDEPKDDALRDRPLSDVRNWIDREWQHIAPKWIAGIGVIYLQWKAALYPVLRSVLKDFATNEWRRHIDLGCGCGIHTLFVCDTVKSFGFSCESLGIDLQRSLVEAAEWFTGSISGIRFEVADILDPDAITLTRTKYGFANVQLVTLFYVLHDLPDYKGALEIATECLCDGGTLLITIISPTSAEAMKAAGLIRLAETPLSTRVDPQTANKTLGYEWIGFYPVVIGENRAIEIPYFHRSYESYLMAIEEVGLSVVGKQRIDVPRVGWTGVSPSSTTKTVFPTTTARDRMMFADVSVDFIVARKDARHLSG